MIKLLLKFGLTVNIFERFQDKFEKETPLNHPVSIRDIFLRRILLDYGAKINALSSFRHFKEDETKLNETLLHTSSQLRFHEGAKLLAT